MKNKTVFIAVPLLLIVFPAIVFLVYYFVYFPKPQEVRVSNITDKSVTVSWETEKPSKGVVLYSEKGDIVSMIRARISGNYGYDDRDESEAELLAAEEEWELALNGEYKVKKRGKYFMHHVTVKNLDPEKEYFFKVGNGLVFINPKKELIDGGNLRFTEVESNKFTTKKEAERMLAPNPSYGQVISKFDDINLLMTDSVVYMLVNDGKGNVILSSVTNEKGNWYIDLTTARGSDGEIMLFNENTGRETVYVNAGNWGESEIVTVQMDVDAPAKDIEIENVNPAIVSNIGWNGLMTPVYAGCPEGSQSGCVASCHSGCTTDACHNGCGSACRSMCSEEVTCPCGGCGDERCDSDGTYDRCEEEGWKDTSTPCSLLSNNSSSESVVEEQEYSPNPVGSGGDTRCPGGDHSSCVGSCHSGCTTEACHSGCDNACVALCNAEAVCSCGECGSEKCGTDGTYDRCEVSGWRDTDKSCGSAASGGGDADCINPNNDDSCGGVGQIICLNACIRGCDTGLSAPVVGNYKGICNSLKTCYCLVENQCQPRYYRAPAEANCSELCGANSWETCTPATGVAAPPVISPDVADDPLNLIEKVNAEEQSYIVSGSNIVKPQKDGVYEIYVAGVTERFEVAMKAGVEYTFYLDKNRNQIRDEGEEIIDMTGNTVEIRYDDSKKIYEMSLRRGLNFVSFNNLPVSMDSCELIKEINSGKSDEGLVTQIARFESNGYDVTSYRKDLEMPVGGDCFPVFPGKGYVLRAFEDTDIVYGGYDLTAPGEILYRQGWNLIGINGVDKQYTAESYLDELNTSELLTVDNLTQWSIDSSSYQGLQKDEGGVYGFDFPLYNNRGYFVRVIEGEAKWP